MQNKPSIPSLAELATSRAELHAQVEHFHQLGARMRKRHSLLLAAGATVSGCARFAGGPQWLMWVALPMMAGIVALLELVHRHQDSSLKSSVAESMQAIADLEAMHKHR